MDLSLSRMANITFDDLNGLRAEGYIRDSTLDQRDGYGPLGINDQPANRIQAETHVIFSPYADIDLTISACQFRSDISLDFILYNLGHCTQIQSQVS